MGERLRVIISGRCEQLIVRTVGEARRQKNDGRTYLREIDNRQWAMDIGSELLPPPCRGPLFAQDGPRGRNADPRGSDQIPLSTLRPVQASPLLQPQWRGLPIVAAAHSTPGEGPRLPPPNCRVNSPPHHRSNPAAKPGLQTDNFDFELPHALEIVSSLLSLPLASNSLVTELISAVGYASLASVRWTQSGNCSLQLPAVNLKLYGGSHVIILPFRRCSSEAWQVPYF